MKTQFIFYGWLRFLLASLGRGFLLLVLLSFSSLTYAVERGEYRHYLGFAISGDQEIDVASDDTDNTDNTDGPFVIDSDIEEGGSLFVWDRFDLDNHGAFSLMLLSVWEDGSGTYSDGSEFEGDISFGGLLAAGKYFISNGFYVGGGIALSALSGDVILQNVPVTVRGRTFLVDANVDIISDSFFAPTLVLGYRGLVSKGEKSHFYIGADWIRTLPVDVDVDYEYETFVSGVGPFDFTVSNTYEELSISMLAVSVGWAW